MLMLNCIKGTVEYFISHTSGGRDITVFRTLTNEPNYLLNSIIF